MNERRKLDGEIQSLYTELARIAAYDPHDTDIRLARRCLEWCLEWRLKRLAELDHEVIPRLGRLFATSVH